jgi:cardiolipin synthase
MRWQTVARYNNRTHRELMVVDGKIGFIGGAGIADHWRVGDGDRPRWRDTMYRLDGPAVAQLQGTFAENWLEASGDILTGAGYFPPLQPGAGSSYAMVVDSSPSAGRSTRARSLFQVLIASARRNIEITTPYFLPDDGVIEELRRAVQERGVAVRIVTPGKQTDHMLTRSSSRGLYGKLLHAGAQIYEYSPGMIHCKSLVIDGLWSVVGSTNLDSRSFGLNDEVNLVVRDPQLASRIHEDFEVDLRSSRRIGYEDWRDRPIWEKAQESVGLILERQQ